MATQNISLPAQHFTGAAFTSATSTESSVGSNWQRLLVDAVSKPGKISQAYTAFHNYSIGNALEALWQCAARQIEPVPINTFMASQILKAGQKCPAPRGETAVTCA